jgi:hypothetical protein
MKSTVRHLVLALSTLSGLPIAAQSTLLTFDGTQADAEFGAIVVNAGDVDADGFDDIIVGQPFYDRLLPNLTFLIDAGRLAHRACVALVQLRARFTRGTLNRVSALCK